MVFDARNCPPLFHIICCAIRDSVAVHKVGSLGNGSKAMAPHSSTLAWKIPWTGEPGRLQSMGSLGVGYDWASSLSLSRIGEGNGNPLQCSCLENPGDGKPGGLPSMGSHGVGHDRSDLAAAAAAAACIYQSQSLNLSLPPFPPSGNYKLVCIHDDSISVMKISSFVPFV